MPAKKASKKARKGSGSKSAAGGSAATKKSTGKKRATKKVSAKKSGTKRGAGAAKGSQRPSTKATAGRATAKKAGGAGARKSPRASKTAARAATAPTGFEALIGNCLGLTEAGAIVENAVVLTGGISSSAFDIDKKLEQMGVISTNQCAVVTSRILQDVRAFPCTINDAAAACTPDMKARALIDSVQANAGRP